MSEYQSTGWVPESQRTTTYYIFEPKFHCKTSLISTMSPEYVKIMGIPGTGIPELDRDRGKEMIDIYLSINQLVEYVIDEGHNVSVVNREDVKKIYTYIQNHLKSWQNALPNILDPKKIPYDDLVKLDKLADVVFPHARKFFDDPNVQSLFMQRVNSTYLFPVNELFKKPKPDPNLPKEEQPPLPQRDSFATVFKKITPRNRRP